MKLFTIALLSLSLSGVAQAAKFQTIKSVESTSLTKLLKAWKNVADGQEDAGWSAAKITEKKDSEAWINTVKQFAYKLGADEASAKRVPLATLNADKQLDVLVQENYYVAETLNEEPHLRRALISALNGLNGNKLVFAGNVTGDTFSYNFITVVDVTRNELLSIYTGTSD